MKTLFLITALLSFNTTIGQLTSLNSYAQEMKNSDDPNLVNLYSNIRNSAIDMWGDNHIMIVSTINQYVDSWVELIEVLGENQDDPKAGKILSDAMEMWTDGPDKNKIVSLISTGSDEALYCCKTNWQMVLATFKQQIEASSAY